MAVQQLTEENLHSVTAGYVSTHTAMMHNESTIKPKQDKYHEHHVSPLYIYIYEFPCCRQMVAKSQKKKEKKRKRLSSMSE